MARLKELYDNELRGKLKEKFGINNICEVPKVTKIVVNMGVGKDSVADSKKINFALDDLMNITGQKPVITKAKKSIAGFKLRKGLSIGCKVTLRKNRMYEFLDRLVYIALPRVRDFKGLSKKSFDANGNYSIGIKEQIIFPEINYDKIDKVRGMDVTIITSTVNQEYAYELLKGFNLPFKSQPAEKKIRQPVAQSELTKKPVEQSAKAQPTEKTIEQSVVTEAEPTKKPAEATADKN